jgi:hypothetical protein
MSSTIKVRVTFMGVEESDMPTIPATYTTGDLSKRYGVPVWQVLQTIRRKFLPEPQRIGVYRVWLEEDLPKIRRALIDAGYLKPGRKEVAAADA